MPDSLVGFFYFRILTAVGLILAALITTVTPILKPLKSDLSPHRLNRFGIAFIIAAVFTVLLSSLGVYYSYLDSKKASEDVQLILKNIRDESMRLANSDFQLVLISMCSAINRDQQIPEFTPIYLKGTIGKADIHIELEEVGDRLEDIKESWVRDYRISGAGSWGPSGGTIRQTDLEIRYFAKSFVIVGLENYPYLKDIEGEEFYFKIDLEKIEFMKATWSHKIILSIKGRECSDELTNEGELNMKIKIEG